jgi:hypothetical protein
VVAASSRSCMSDAPATVAGGVFWRRTAANDTDGIVDPSDRTSTKYGYAGDCIQDRQCAVVQLARGRMVVTHVMRQWSTPLGLRDLTATVRAFRVLAGMLSAPVTVMRKAASIRDRTEASSAKDCCNQDDPEQQQPEPPREIQNGQSQQCHGDAFRVLQGRSLSGRMSGKAKRPTHWNREGRLEIRRERSRRRRSRLRCRRWLSLPD